MSSYVLLLCSVQSQYADVIEGILIEGGVRDWVRHSMSHGGDRDGRHHGDKIFPGHVASFWAYVAPDRVDDIFERLRSFRNASKAHEHLNAAIVTPDRTL